MHGVDNHANGDGGVGADVDSDGVGGVDNGNGVDDDGIYYCDVVDDYVADGYADFADDGGGDDGLYTDESF